MILDLEKKLAAQDDKIFQLLNIVTSTNQKLMDLKCLVDELAYGKVT